MAQISMNDIKKLEKTRNCVHDKVYATYTVFEQGGQRFVQIDTYGRIGRENPEKISQSFQLDKDAAQFIVKLLQKEFSLK